MDKLKLKAKYEETPDHKMSYANGMTGGISFRNEFVIRFYTEIFPFANTALYEVQDDEEDKDSRILIPLDDDDTPTEEEANTVNVTRIVSSTIILDKETAIELRNFINHHLEEDDSIDDEKENINNPNKEPNEN